MSHDCCDPSDSKNIKKAKFDPFVAGIILITVLILGAAAFLGSRAEAPSQVAADAQVALAIDSNKHDWGTIDINGGIVSKSFEIKNTSKSVLKLYDITTSCMCTTAQLKSSEATSKKYGMHEKSADIFEVKPGKTAELIVEFDPAFHGPSGVGLISRIINISTNDAKNPALTFSLTANVVKK